MNELIGKTIMEITKERVDGCFEDANEEIFIKFTDGTELKIESWDYECYKSGINININNNAMK